MKKYLSMGLVFGIALASFIISCPLQLNAATEHRSLDEVQRSLDATQKHTEAATQTLEGRMAEEQRSMRAERERLRVEVAERKLKAESLQAEFTALKTQEQELEEALAEKKDMMDSIQSTVGNNAGLFLQSAPTYISQNLTDEQRKTLEGLVQTKTFPTLSAIESLLGVLQSSLYQSGIIQKNRENIYIRDGQQVQADVLHLGAFQSYIHHNNEFGFTLRTRLLEPLEMVPYVANEQEAQLIQGAFSGVYTLPLDVTDGQLLLSPPKQYSFLLTVQESGLFGWCIIVIGILGLLLAIERYISLARIRLQGEKLATHILQHPEDMTSLQKSPVGRVLRQMLFGDNAPSSAEQQTHVPHVHDPHVLERRAEEAMLKELPALERFLGTIRIFAAVSPLLGLLGTVSGIVTTFRVITAFGNSDPKMLSGGISEALLTTEMGLLAAIPLLLIHHFLHRRMQNIVLDMELASTIVIKHFTKS